MLIDIKYDKKFGTSFNLLDGSDFYSNGASVPRIFWWFCTPLDARYLKAFWKHDWYYTVGFNRSEADKILKNDLINAGMPKIKANIIYFTVRIFGRHYWFNNN